MTASIQLNDVSLKFRVYRDKGLTLKDTVINLFKKDKISGYHEFDALSGINLDIKTGDRIGIVGINGAGKSSLLRVISRIYKPSSGSLKISGSVAPLLEIGAGFNPEFTGRDNIYFNGSLLGLKNSEIARIEEEIIEFSGVRDFIDHPVKYYSTGMYMRLAFTIATSIKPNILLLDELFAGGDIGFIDKAKKRMLGLIHQCSIMIFVSHTPDLLLELCNRIIWLDAGKIKEDGNPDAVLESYISYIQKGGQ